MPADTTYTKGQTDPRSGTASLHQALSDSERGVEYTTWQGWRTLDAHERALGEADTSPVERERVRVVPRDEQVEISRGGVSAPVA